MRRFWTHITDLQSREHFRRTHRKQQAAVFQLQASDPNVSNTIGDRVEYALVETRARSIDFQEVEVELKTY